jgi:hypothetical protein
MPWCPECHAEYEAGVARCSDCEVDLVEQLPEEAIGEPPVIVFVANSHSEAMVVAATLRSEGIPTYLDSPGPVLPMADNPVEESNPELSIMVPANMVTKAEQIIKAQPFTEEELTEAQTYYEENLPSESEPPIP